MRGYTPRGQRGLSRHALIICLSIICVLLFSQDVRSFQVPERLEYDLTWLGIKAGESVLEISRDEEGRLEIFSTARSVGWVSFFYPVKDRVESLVDTGPQWFPLRYRLKQREGNRERDFEITFDTIRKKALHSDYLENSQMEYDIPETIFDPLSALFEVRKAELIVGESVYVTLFDSRKVYDLEVKVLK